MAILRNVSAPGYLEDIPGTTDTRAMSVATSLFFMVGFLTCLNDIVSPHLKSIFGLNYSEVQAIPFFFFSSYFVFSLPSGKLVETYGYKKTMVVGLFVMAIGALGFVPAAHFALFPLFLVALVILAGGMTVVQVAINPYVTVIGPPQTAASRLNLAQAFNSVGTFLAPIVGTALILRNATTPLSSASFHALSTIEQKAYRTLQASTVNKPYLLIALALVLLALALAAIKLKTTNGVSTHTQDFRPGAFAEAFSKPDSIWNHPWLLFAALGIFVYVGAEVSIGNLLVNYMGLHDVGNLPEINAGYLLTFYWGGAMLGRFIGSAILQRVRAGILLGLAGLGAFLLVVISLKSSFLSGVSTTVPFHFLYWSGSLILPHSLPMWSMLAVGLCNSIMFPSIFTMGIQDLGPLTSKGSSLLVAAILGGAIIPKLQGILADHIGLHPSFIVPTVCYIYIAVFGVASMRRRAAYDGLIPSEPV